MGLCKMPDKERQTCSLSPEGSDVQRGSFINSQAKMVGSSLYVTFVNVFTLLSTVYAIHMGINKYHYHANKEYNEFAIQFSLYVNHGNIRSNLPEHEPCSSS